MVRADGESGAVMVVMFGAKSGVLVSRRLLRRDVAVFLIVAELAEDENGNPVALVVVADRAAVALALAVVVFELSGACPLVREDAGSWGCSGWARVGNMNSSVSIVFSPLVASPLIASS